MAKGLRSHTKKKYRAIKRDTVFKPVEDARLLRLAAAQAEAANKPKVGDYMDDETVEKQDNSMAVDGAEQSTQKISTGGSKKYRKRRKIEKKKKNSHVF